MDFILMLKALMALALVVGLMLGFVWLMKRFQSKLGAFSAFGGVQGGRRIEVLETRRIDAKNVLVLLRRDEREHLVLVSHGGQNLLVESGISEKGKK